MRLFVAIPPGSGALAELSAVVGRLRAGGDGLRWTDPGSWHITLSFLGSTSDEQYEALRAALGRVQAGPVPIRAAAFGCFERSGVFYAGVQPTPQLAALAERVATAATAAGFPRDPRPYHPHITLARSRGTRVRELRRLPDAAGTRPAFGGFLASVFVLYESLLEPAGARHIARARYPLAGE